MTHFGFEGGTLVLIASVPGHCLSFTFISEFLWLCRMVAPKRLPAHTFNALIFPILGIVCNQFAFFLSLDAPLSILVISNFGFEGGT